MAVQCTDTHIQTHTVRPFERRTDKVASLSITQRKQSNLAVIATLTTQMDEMKCVLNKTNQNEAEEEEDEEEKREQNPKAVERNFATETLSLSRII